MFEIINKVDGKEIPQLVMVDEHIGKKLIRRLRESNINILRKGKNRGLENGMPDDEIVELGRTLGGIPIITQDKGFFRYKKNGYEKIIVLNQMDSIYQHVRKIRNAGIEMNGNLLPYKMGRYSVLSYG